MSKKSSASKVNANAKVVPAGAESAEQVAENTLDPRINAQTQAAVAAEAKEAQAKALKAKKDEDAEEEQVADSSEQPVEETAEAAAEEAEQTAEASAEGDEVAVDAEAVAEIQKIAAELDGAAISLDALAGDFPLMFAQAGGAAAGTAAGGAAAGAAVAGISTTAIVAGVAIVGVAAAAGGGSSSSTTTSTGTGGTTGETPVTPITVPTSSFNFTLGSAPTVSTGTVSTTLFSLDTTPLLDAASAAPSAAAAYSAIDSSSFSETTATFGATALDDYSSLLTNGYLATGSSSSDVITVTGSDLTSITDPVVIDGGAGTDVVLIEAADGDFTNAVYTTSVDVIRITSTSAATLTFDAENVSSGEVQEIWNWAGNGDISIDNLESTDPVIGIYNTDSDTSVTYAATSGIDKGSTVNVALVEAEGGAITFDFSGISGGGTVTGLSISSGGSVANEVGTVTAGSTVTDVEIFGSQDLSITLAQTAMSGLKSVDASTLGGTLDLNAGSLKSTDYTAVAGSGSDNSFTASLQASANLALDLTRFDDVNLTLAGGATVDATDMLATDGVTVNLTSTVTGALVFSDVARGTDFATTQLTRSSTKVSYAAESDFDFGVSGSGKTVALGDLTVENARAAYITMGSGNTDLTVGAVNIDEGVGFVVTTSKGDVTQTGNLKTLSEGNVVISATSTGAGNITLGTPLASSSESVSMDLNASGTGVVTVGAVGSTALGGAFIGDLNATVGDVKLTSVTATGNVGVSVAATGNVESGSSTAADVTLGDIVSASGDIGVVVDVATAGKEGFGAYVDLGAMTASNGDVSLTVTTAGGEVAATAATVAASLGTANIASVTDAGTVWSNDNISAKDTVSIDITTGAGSIVGVASEVTAGTAKNITATDGDISISIDNNASSNDGSFVGVAVGNLDGTVDRGNISAASGSIVLDVTNDKGGFVEVGDLIAGEEGYVSIASAGNAVNTGYLDADAKVRVAVSLSGGADTDMGALTSAESDIIVVANLSSTADSSSTLNMGAMDAKGAIGLEVTATGAGNNDANATFGALDSESTVDVVASLETKFDFKVTSVTGKSDVFVDFEGGAGNQATFGQILSSQGDIDIVIDLDSTATAKSEITMGAVTATDGDIILAISALGASGNVDFGSNDVQAADGLVVVSSGTMGSKAYVNLDAITGNQVGLGIQAVAGSGTFDVGNVTAADGDISIGSSVASTGETSGSVGIAAKGLFNVGNLELTKAGDITVDVTAATGGKFKTGTIDIVNGTGMFTAAIGDEGKATIGTIDVTKGDVGLDLSFGDESTANTVGAIVATAGDVAISVSSVGDTSQVQFATAKADAIDLAIGTIGETGTVTTGDMTAADGDLTIGGLMSSDGSASGTVTLGDSAKLTTGNFDLVDGNFEIALTAGETSIVQLADVDVTRGDVTLEMAGGIGADLTVDDITATKGDISLAMSTGEAGSVDVGNIADTAGNVSVDVAIGDAAGATVGTITATKGSLDVSLQVGNESVNTSIGDITSTAGRASVDIVSVGEAAKAIFGDIKGKTVNIAVQETMESATVTVVDLTATDGDLIIGGSLTDGIASGSAALADSGVFNIGTVDTTDGNATINISGGSGVKVTVGAIDLTAGDLDLSISGTGGSGVTLTSVTATKGDVGIDLSTGSGPLKVGAIINSAGDVSLDLATGASGKVTTSTVVATKGDIDLTLELGASASTVDFGAFTAAAGHISANLVSIGDSAHGNLDGMKAKSIDVAITETGEGATVTLGALTVTDGDLTIGSTLSATNLASGDASLGVEAMLTVGAATLTKGNVDIHVDGASDSVVKLTSAAVTAGDIVVDAALDGAGKVTLGALSATNGDVDLDLVLGDEGGANITGAISVTAGDVLLDLTTGESGFASVGAISATKGDVELNLTLGADTTAVNFGDITATAGTVALDLSLAAGAFGNLEDVVKAESIQVAVDLGEGATASLGGLTATDGDVTIGGTMSALNVASGDADAGVDATLSVGAIAVTDGDTSIAFAGVAESVFKGSTITSTKGDVTIDLTAGADSGLTVGAVQATNGDVDVILSQGSGGLATVGNLIGNGDFSVEVVASGADSGVDFGAMSADSLNISLKAIGDGATVDIGALTVTDGDLTIGGTMSASDIATGTADFGADGWLNVGTSKVTDGDFTLNFDGENGSIVTVGAITSTKGDVDVSLSVGDDGTLTVGAITATSGDVTLTLDAGDSGVIKVGTLSLADGDLTVTVTSTAASSGDSAAVTFAGNLDADSINLSYDSEGAGSIAISTNIQVNDASTGSLANVFDKNSSFGNFTSTSAGNVDLGSQASIDAYDWAVDMEFTGSGNVTIAADKIDNSSGQYVRIDASSLTGSLSLNGNADMDGSAFVLGGSGADTITTGSEADYIDAGAGVDVLDGGAGADIFAFGSGDTGSTLATADIINNYQADDALVFAFGSTVTWASMNADFDFVLNGNAETAFADILADANASFATAGGNHLVYAVGNTDLEGTGAETLVFVNINGDTDFDAGTDLLLRVRYETGSAFATGNMDIGFLA